MNNKGIHSWRLQKDQNNPREVAFAESWERLQRSSPLHSLLCASNDNIDRKSNASDRDHIVAATVIQWLGSNCGMSFLQQVIEHNPQVKEWLTPKK